MLPPRAIYFEVTNRCNAECVMCPREKMSRPVGKLSHEALNQIAQELKDFPIEFVSLTGFGEPLLDRELPLKIRKLKASGFPRVMITTNFSAFRPHLVEELLDSGLDLLSISFYGNSAEEYERIMQGLKYDRTVENLKTYLKIRKLKKARGPRLQSRGLGWFNIVFRFDHVFHTHFAHRLLTPYLNLRQRILGKLKYTWHNFGDGRNYRKVPNADANSRCRFIEDDSLTLLWNGDVVTCCRDYDGKVRFGNVLKDGVKAVWESPRYQKFREDLHQGRTEAYPYCHGCDTLRPQPELGKTHSWKHRLLFGSDLKTV